MTHQDECSVIRDLVDLAMEHGPDAMAAAFATLMNHAMQIEREQVLKAESHQRTADRQGYANGFKPKTLNTRVGQVDLRIPQTRGYRDENGRPFYPKALGRGVRSERAMILAMAEMYVQGVSTRKVTAIVEEVMRTRSHLDAGEPRRCSVQLSEAEPHWRKFLESLQKRGMHGVKLVVSDDHAGLRTARQAVMARVPWQRCQFHTIRNAMAHVPKVAMRSEVARDLRRVFDADEPAEAERRLKDIVARYQKTAPQLAAWLEQAAPEAITVLMIPLAHRRRLRTTNGLERLNREIKRRTRVATLFPNEASLLRLASAVLSEISDDWETERAYLNMEAR